MATKIRKYLRALILLTLILACVFSMYMPGRSYEGSLSRPNPSTVNRLSEIVTELGGTIGERNWNKPTQLKQARDYIVDVLRSQQCVPAELLFGPSAEFANIECIQHGTDPELAQLVVGAHYDSAPGSPAANDNGSGVAALLELHARLQSYHPKRTIRWVAFSNEEPPFFQTDLMGSFVYANALTKSKIPLFGMISLETIGYYSDTPGSQRYPFPLNWFYPSTGNFLTFVGNPLSSSFTRRLIRMFRATQKLPSEGAILPDILPGIGWSDHWSFWQVGVPAVMVTDTAPFRYPHYHTQYDLPDKLDYNRFALAVDGLETVLKEISE